jgi:hypothetical protein
MLPAVVIGYLQMLPKFKAQMVAIQINANE